MVKIHQNTHHRTSKLWERENEKLNTERIISLHDDKVMLLFAEKVTLRKGDNDAAAIHKGT